MKNKRFLISDRVKSFKNAFAGLTVLFHREHNSRIHLAAATCVILAGIIFNISIAEWLALVIVIGLVFIAEIFNSTVEYLSDFVSPQYNNIIKDVKDLSASAVLISATVAVAVGLLIFLPKIFN